MNLLLILLAILGLFTYLVYCLAVTYIINCKTIGRMHITLAMCIIFTPFLVILVYVPYKFIKDIITFN